MGIKNENIEEVIANQKVGVIENFYNNYRLVMYSNIVGVAYIC